MAGRLIQEEETLRWAAAGGYNCSCLQERGDRAVCNEKETREGENEEYYLGLTSKKASTISEILLVSLSSPLVTLHFIVHVTREQGE